MAEGKYLIGESLREKLKSTIAKVDSIPFGGPVSRIPTSFVAEGPSYVPKVFRVCTFTGSWAINTDNVVTFRGVTTTPNTVSATNLFYDLPSNGSSTSTCAVAKDGTAWYLISAEPAGVRRGTFTAPWNKGSTKTVTNAVATTITYSNVRNYFANLTGSGLKNCAITYVGGEWILIAAEC